MSIRKLGLGAFAVGGAAGALAFAATPALAAPVAPSVTIAPVSAVSYTTAQVSGTVNPHGGPATAWRFEDSTDGGVAWEQVASGELTEVQAKGSVAANVGPVTLEGLTPGTAYEVRLVAVTTNTEGGEAQEAATVAPYPSFTTKAVAPPTVTIGATPTFTATTAHFTGTVDPDAPGGEPHAGAFDTSWHFECTPECPGLAGGEVPADDVAHEVSVDATGLVPNTMYFVTLVASNADRQEVVAGPTVFTTLIAEPKIISESATDVADASAVLNAEINPGGGATTYRFQYGRGVAYGQETEESLPIGSDDSVHSVKMTIAGLTPDTEYHYRVLATNAAAEEVLGKEDLSFTTQSAGAEATLPDGRAWEQVSPQNKHGAGVTATSSGGGLTQAAADGGAITYLSHGSPTVNPEGERGPEYDQILAVRGEHGWESQNLAPPNRAVYESNVGNEAQYALFSSNLALGLLETKGETHLAPPVVAGETQETSPYMRAVAGIAPEAAQQADYVRATADGVAMGNGGFLALLTAGDVLSGQPFGGSGNGGSGIAAVTEDASHVAFTSPHELTGTWTNNSENQNLYEWGEGRLNLISALPGGEPASENNETAELGGDQGEVTRNALSGDGSRAVWEAGEASSQHVYLSDPARGETVAIDLPAPGVEPGEKSRFDKSRFQTASSDDTSVFFTSPLELTADSHAEEERPDLYVFTDPAGPVSSGGRLEDITKTEHPGEPADVVPDGDSSFVVGASRNGEYVYFAANGILAPGAEAGSCGQGGSGNALCNLYVARRSGGSWSTKFIAVLSEGDIETFGDGLQGLTARVSPDGRYVAFMSRRSLTGYDNRDAASGELDEEVYLYDAGTSKLVCASCDPSGARPIGRLDPSGQEGEGNPLVDPLGVWRNRWLAANVPGWTPFNSTGALYQPRYLLDSGRLFFNSTDSLVPAAPGGSESVYEYEPSGQGSCPSAAPSAATAVLAGEAGCVSLLSGPPSNTESVFLDASETGSDVFLLTASPLISSDHDSAYDVYDAHECSASPCSASAAESLPPCTEAATCRAPATPQPAFLGAPPSSTLTGPGNVAPQTAAAPIVKRARTSPRARALAAALKACAKQRPARRRAGCEKEARVRYGTSGAKRKLKAARRRTK